MFSFFVQGTFAIGCWANRPASSRKGTQTADGTHMGSKVTDTPVDVASRPCCARRVGSNSTQSTYLHHSAAATETLPTDHRSMPAGTNLQVIGVSDAKYPPMMASVRCPCCNLEVHPAPTSEGYPRAIYRTKPETPYIDYIEPVRNIIRNMQHKMR